MSISFAPRKEDTEEFDDAPIGLNDVEDNDLQVVEVNKSHEDQNFGTISGRNQNLESIPSRKDLDYESEEGRVSQLRSIRRLNSFQLNQNDTSIQVLNPITKSDRMSKLIFYTIKGSDREDSFEVPRTQDQFMEIRNILIARWPGCYVPALPPKRMIANTTPSFLEQRRKQFEMFCQKISELPYLHYSVEYQTFLKSTSTDILTELAKYQRVDYHEIISRYNKTFRHALSEEMTTATYEKIEQFKEFLQGVHGNFKRYKQVLKGIVKARQSYYDQFHLLQETMCSDFERKVLSGYESNMDRSTSNIGSDAYITDIKEKVVKIQETGQSESMEYLHAWTKLEAREVEAFLEAIAQREKYMAVKGKVLEKQRAATKTLDKILEGRNTLKTMFSKKGRDEEADIMEKEITNYRKEVDLLNTLIERITLVLAYSEIDKYKKNKSDEYRNVVTMAAQNEIVKLRDMGDFWGALLRGQGPNSLANVDSA